METKEGINEYSETILSVDEVIQLLLAGQKVDGVLLNTDEEVDMYNANAKQILHDEDSNINISSATGSVDEYHEKKAGTWHMPEKYKTINVEDYLVELCPSQRAIDRTMIELNMFEERGLEDVLRMLIYLVDYFRENDIVWGVGRGSSVSSYVLFLIGIHKIDSIKYDLSITEFLK